MSPKMLPCASISLNADDVTTNVPVLQANWQRILRRNYGTFASKNFRSWERKFHTMELQTLCLYSRSNTACTGMWRYTGRHDTTVWYSAHVPGQSIKNRARQGSFSRVWEFFTKRHQAMPRSKSRAKKAARPASPPSAALAAVEEQEEHPADLPPPDEPAAAAAADLITESEAEEAEDAPGRKRAASRVGTNFSEDEKDLIIEFLQKTRIREGWPGTRNQRSRKGCGPNKQEWWIVHRTNYKLL